MKNIIFGNNNNDFEKLGIDDSCGIKLLANVGQMTDCEDLDIEKEKVRIAIENDVDIIADNTITSKSYEFKSWIKRNHHIMLNSVPVYERFFEMKNGTFTEEMLLDTIKKYIDYGCDMLVVHPGINDSLMKKIIQSQRIIKVTSRGGAQIYNYMKNTSRHNPYLGIWKRMCEIIQGTGVSLAIGFSLRAGSILDDLDPIYLEEMDNIGELIDIAHDHQIPVVVEGVGHVRAQNLPILMAEIRKRCRNVPIKTLGPLLSDRMCGYEHINALIGSVYAITQGASIIGALFKSEHLGLPTIEDFQESLPNYKILKYLFNLDQSDLQKELEISKERSNRSWGGIFSNAFNPDLAKNIFLERNNHVFSKDCTMCGERCALIENNCD